jgi:hypothetical protein
LGCALSIEKYGITFLNEFVTPFCAKSQPPNQATLEAMPSFGAAARNFSYVCSIPLELANIQC